MPLQSALGPNAPFILAWPGMMFAAVVGGFWPTVIVGAVGLAVGQWALAEGGARPAGPGGVVIFTAFTLAFATAGGALKRGRRRARADAARIAELQSRMVNVARLNAMGEMAGSLAHELNQPLTAIANYLNAAEQVLMTADDGKARSAELIRKAAGQAVRAGQIVARIRASVDRGEVILAEESLSHLARDAVDAAVAGRADAEVDIHYEFDRVADRILADRIQVQQVVLNLVRNSLDAMEDRPRRDLRIGSRIGEPGFVETFVADSGPGVAPHVADRLFQPFVSGKTGSMGLGLSICRSIVEAHGGRLWAPSSAAGGAAFHFTLPRAGRRAPR
ncbi:MAG: sensor histidine kinase [Pseudomonadota bacterium]